MSYTLRGRLETRLAAALLPFLVAAVLAPILHKWWPLELAGLMLAIGLALDVDRLSPSVPLPARLGSRSRSACSSSRRRWEPHGCSS